MAAAQGLADAHFHLGDLYNDRRDSKQALIHYEAAAYKGHPEARHS